MYICYMHCYYSLEYLLWNVLDASDKLLEYLLLVY